MRTELPSALSEDAKPSPRSLSTESRPLAEREETLGNWQQKLSAQLIGVVAAPAFRAQRGSWRERLRVGAVTAVVALVALISKSFAYDAARKEPAVTIQEVTHIADGPVYVGAFSPDSRMLVTGSRGAHLIETATGKEVAVLAPDIQVQGIAFSPDGRLLRITNDRTASAIDRTVRMIEIGTRKEVTRIEGEGGDVVFSPDGGLFVRTNDDGPGRVIEHATGREVVRMERGDSLAFSLDGRFLATTNLSSAYQPGITSLTTRLIETASGNEVARLERKDLFKVVVISSDGHRLVMTDPYHSGRLIETASGKELAQFASLVYEALSPDDRWLATASENAQVTGMGFVQLFDTASGKEMTNVVCWSPFRGVVFSPDGRWLAVLSGSGPQLIETTSGKEATVIEGRFSSAAFSPDGQLLATARDDNTVRLSQTVSGKEMARIAYDAAVGSLAFSPDGHWLASAGDAGARLLRLEP